MSFYNVRNISFSYLNETDNKSILENLSFTVSKGEFIAILGPSGCGKTTLLNLLSGFKSPNSGEIYLNNKLIECPFPKGQMVFQNTDQLLPWLTVEKNIIFPKFRYNIFNKKKVIPSNELVIYSELLKITGLDQYRNYYPNQLSEGLKQRTSIVRALFSQPEILFMDEPFVSLDAPTRSELQNLLLKLWEMENRTIFFVTHDIEEALLLTDKILIFSGNNNIQLIDNSLLRPRNRDNKNLIDLKHNLYSIIEQT